MCGIVGIVARDAQVPAGVLERANASLAHRGPDDGGTIIIRTESNGGAPDIEVGLANRRLAILDLSPLGHQPMQDPHTGNWIVYNGEIYNFRDVRAQLEDLGERFRSKSDTEVILRAYAHWGENCLTRFRGMYAFALWDASRQRLWMVRDPMGIKPLYYAQIANYFIFASEVRTILGTGLLQKKLSTIGLLNYLTFGSAYDPHTLAEGVYALPSGHSLRWQDGTVEISPYWDLADESSTPILNNSTAHLREILEESVRLQLVSDVPIGVFLSGGIDSSALVSILSRSGVTPATFSVVFREQEFSEEKFSRAVAERFHTDHHEIVVSQQDFLNAIPDALRAMDQPSMDAINTYFVSRETRAAGVKVALSGLGGDEVFCGYSTFRTVPRMEKAAGIARALPALLRRAGSSVLRTVSDTDASRKLAALSADEVVHPYFLARMLFTTEQCGELFPGAADAAEDAGCANGEMLSRAESLDPINQVSYLESSCYMRNTLLRDADCMSMAHGLEVRVPLIDHILAKAVLRIPGAQKLGSTPKQLLVDAMDGSLPTEIVHRKKRGFTMPFEQWLRGDLRTTVATALSASNVAHGPLRDVLDSQAVEHTWFDFIGGRTSWSRAWSLYVLLEWCSRNLS